MLNIFRTDQSLHSGHSHVCFCEGVGLDVASDGGGRSQRKPSIQVPALLLLFFFYCGNVNYSIQECQGRGQEAAGGSPAPPNLAGRRFAEEAGVIMATYTDQTYLCTCIKYIPVGKWSPRR